MQVKVGVRVKTGKRVRIRPVQELWNCVGRMNVMISGHLLVDDRRRTSRERLAIVIHHKPINASGEATNTPTKSNHPHPASLT